MEWIRSESTLCFSREEFNICWERFYGKREGMDLRGYFVETMCGLVANPVAQTWNGSGRNPHLVSVRRDLKINVRDFMGKERDWIGGNNLWKQCVESLLTQWHVCGMG